MNTRDITGTPDNGIDTKLQRRINLAAAEVVRCYGDNCDAAETENAISVLAIALMEAEIPVPDSLEQQHLLECDCGSCSATELCEKIRSSKQ